MRVIIKKTGNFNFFEMVFFEDKDGTGPDRDSFVNLTTLTIF